MFYSERKQLCLSDRRDPAQTATCIKASGVAAVIAVSFSRLFFRNAINEGLLVVEFASGTAVIAMDDQVKIDFEKGTVTHNGKSYAFPALPREVFAILNDGGLIPHVKKALGMRERRPRFHHPEC